MKVNKLRYWVTVLVALCIAFSISTILDVTLLKLKLYADSQVIIRIFLVCTVAIVSYAFAFRFVSKLLRCKIL